MCLHSTDTQNILEVLSFGILNKKNTICAVCQSQFENHFCRAEHDCAATSYVTKKRCDLASLLVCSLYSDLIHLILLAYDLLDRIDLIFHVQVHRSRHALLILHRQSLQDLLVLPDQNRIIFLIL